MAYSWRLPLLSFLETRCLDNSRKPRLLRIENTIAPCASETNMEETLWILRSPEANSLRCSGSYTHQRDMGGEWERARERARDQIFSSFHSLLARIVFFFFFFFFLFLWVSSATTVPMRPCR